MADAEANGGPGGGTPGDQKDDGRGPGALDGGAARRLELSFACVWDADGRLVKTERFVKEGGRWRLVGPVESVPGLEEAEQAAGRWTIAWGDDEADDGTPSQQTATLPGDPPARCPDCKGTGVILLLTSRRSCERCGGSGSVKG